VWGIWIGVLRLSSDRTKLTSPTPPSPVVGLRNLPARLTSHITFDHVGNQLMTDTADNDPSDRVSLLLVLPIDDPDTDIVFRSLDTAKAVSSNAH
jgi:hypothetical protein